MPDDLKSIISSRLNSRSFVYTISTVEVVEETTFAAAPLSLPTSNSPWTVLVRSVDLLIRLNLGRFGSPVVEDSNTARTRTPSGTFKDISSSWTLVP